MKRFLFIGPLLFIMWAIMSCNEEDSNEEINDGSENTIDVAVTSVVTEYGATYANIKGYVNLHLLTSNGTPTVGIELSIDDDLDEAEIKMTKTTNELTKNSFTIDFFELTSNTCYKYRTFVSSGGMNRKFTTKDFTNITSTGENRVLGTAVSIESSLRTDLIDAKEDLSIGVAYTLNASALHPNGEFETSQSTFKEVKNGRYITTLINLLPETTYYYASFTKVGTNYKVGNVKEFTTAKNMMEIVVDSVNTNSIYCHIDMFTSERIDASFFYGTSKSSVVNNKSERVQGEKGEDVYYSQISGLTPNTTYYLKAIVSCNMGSSATEVVEVTTDSRKPGADDNWFPGVD